MSKTAAPKNCIEFSNEEIIEYFNTIYYDSEAIRNNDRKIISAQFDNFYGKKLNIGIGYQRAYGSLLSGDYYELFMLPDGNYLFVFADISGHGLPAYTTLIRLRCSIALAVKEIGTVFKTKGSFNVDDFILDIGNKFTDIMESYNSQDFASIIFTYIRREEDKFILKFYNRGMFFPFVVRKFQNVIKDIYDLNLTEKGWFPVKGFLLGKDVRLVLGEKYNEYPSCEFIIYEGDSLLYFSDGITEATNRNNPQIEFGTSSLKKLLIENVALHPSAVISNLFDEIYLFIGSAKRQADDMTVVLIDFPLVR